MENYTGIHIVTVTTAAQDPLGRRARAWWTGGPWWATQTSPRLGSDRVSRGCRPRSGGVARRDQPRRRAPRSYVRPAPVDRPNRRRRTVIPAGGGGAGGAAPGRTAAGSGSMRAGDAVMSRGSGTSGGCDEADVSGGLSRVGDARRPWAASSRAIACSRHGGACAGASKPVVAAMRAAGGMIVLGADRRAGQRAFVDHRVLLCGGIIRCPRPSDLRRGGAGCGAIVGESAGRRVALLAAAVPLKGVFGR